MKARILLREVELVDRLGWYINIRWFTVAFIACAGFVARSFFGVDVPLDTVLVIASVIALYNLFFVLYLKRIKTHRVVAVDLPRRAERFVLLQAILDLVVLLVLIHYTGGAENPFIFYFIFHTVLSSMLLSKRAGYIQSLFVVTSVGWLLSAEYLSIIPHHHLKGFMDSELYANPVYLTALYFVFTTSVLLTAHITVSVTERLRERENELMEKSLELKRANKALKEKDRLKSEYVRMVAHDIKSPLSSILSLLNVASEGYAGSLDEKTREIIERAAARVQELHSYATDLLNLSRMRSGLALNIETVEAGPLIDRALVLAKDAEGQKELRITKEVERGLPPVRADKEQLLHVLLNLIGNALKYTPPGGEVRISAGVHDGMFELRVSDTGIGIPKDELPRIFDEFYRGRSAEKTSRGTGFGLALVKHIVERHSGTIEVRSEEGKGSVFIVRLPLDGPKG